MTTKIKNTNLDTTIVTGFTDLGETVATDDVVLVFDTSTNSLKKVSTLNMQLGAPTITSISPTNVDSKDSATTTTFTVTGTNFYPGTTAKLKNNSGSDINFNTVTRDSNTQLTCVLNNALITAEGVTDEPYDISVTNSLGTGTLDNQINVDQRPVFVTASGEIFNSRSTTVSATIEATDPESAGAVRYDLVAGALPSGTSLNSSTGVISGTITPETSDTTYNFTIQASDVDSNVSLRDFSITLLGPQVTSFTSSGTFSVPVGISSVDVLVVAGGGAGGGGTPQPGAFSAGGGGAGGLIFRPAFPVTPGGTVSVTVGCAGTIASPNTTTPGGSGQDSVFGTLTAKGGGGGGKGEPGDQPGVSGGSGGGGGRGTPGAGATQPTQPGDSGTYGFGNSGGAGGPYTAGGGGGSGGSGGSGTGFPCSGGTNFGGAGRSHTIADGTTPVYYAGGGGGGNHGNPFPAPVSATGVTRKGEAGAANTGSGGGGGNPGGKGIVIVRF
jgi:hypothetical protein